MTRDDYDYFDELMSKAKINGMEYDLADCPLVRYFKSDFSPELLTEEDHIILRNYMEKRGFNLVTFDDLYPHYKINNLDQEELSLMNLHFWLSLRRKGHLFIKKFQNTVLPNIVKVYALEAPVSLKNEENDEFVGFVDIICDYKLPSGEIRKVLFDFKTASKKYSQDKIEQSQQLSLYDYVSEIGTVGYIVGLKEVKTPKRGQRVGQTFVEIQVMTHSIPQETQDSFIQDADDVLQMIKQEEFPCNKENCLMYNQRCEFYNLCNNNDPSGLFRKLTKLESCDTIE